MSNKSILIVCALYLVIAEARPKWQFLPEMPGYVPVYIQNGDTPLAEINPELAEAFHALPAGRSAGKLVDAVPEIPEKKGQPEIPEQNDQPEIPEQKEKPEIPEQKEQPEIPEQKDQPEISPEPTSIDKRPYEKKLLEKKKKASNITKPVEY